MVIDADVTVDDLLESYVNGNHSDVLRKLSQDHCGLAVLFVTEGIKRKMLTLSDVNSITNRLLDDRRELVK